jgi:hypothetical protein
MLVSSQDMCNGSWFCCTDCTWVHNSLEKICALGAKVVSTPFLDLLKKHHITENNPDNLSWQIFRGGNTENRVLLSQSLQLLKVRLSAMLFTGKSIVGIFEKETLHKYLFGLSFEEILLLCILSFRVLPY